LFVGEQARLDVAFAAARESLARGGMLAEVSRRAYAEGISSLHNPDSGMGPGRRVGGRGQPELVEVQARELVRGDAMAILALRWQAWDPAAGLFPALDANLTLSPDPPASVLTLAATYRPPPGHAAAGLDRAVVYQAASATIAGFLSRIAEVLSASDADYL